MVIKYGPTIEELDKAYDDAMFGSRKPPLFVCCVDGEVAWFKLQENGEYVKVDPLA